MKGDDTLYRKVGNRYVEAGIHTDVDMYPGVWIVQKFKSSSSMQSICVSELPTVSSIIEVVQAKLLAHIITEKLKPLWDNGSLAIYNQSWCEFEWMIADAITEHLNRGREEAVGGDHNTAQANGIRMAQQVMEEIQNPSEKNTWHGSDMTKIELLMSEINDIAHRKVGTHEFVWFIGELKRLLKANGFDLKDTSVGGFVVNPKINSE